MCYFFERCIGIMWDSIELYQIQSIKARQRRCFFHAVHCCCMGAVIIAPADSPMYNFPALTSWIIILSAPVLCSSCSRKNAFPPVTYIKSLPFNFVFISSDVAVDISKTSTIRPNFSRAFFPDKRQPFLLHLQWG